MTAPDSPERSSSERFRSRLLALVEQGCPVDQVPPAGPPDAGALLRRAHPIVCFGIAFPTLVLMLEWLHLRTGDPLYRQLAKRWSKAMLALFAVGVVTGTILSFEMGLLWPGFMARFGEVFGLGFALEGISFFVEAIFIAIYVYGWDRLSPRLHLLSGIRSRQRGSAGSLMVLSVNAWMQNPSGFRLEGGRAVDVEPIATLRQSISVARVHMYLAAYIVVGFLIAGAYAWSWLRGRRSRYVTVALAPWRSPRPRSRPADRRGRLDRATGRRGSAHQARRVRGLGEDTEGRAIHIGGWYDRDTSESARNPATTYFFAADLPIPTPRSGP
jgi:cytochrome d ubiquinol oxidase subunit I